MPSSAVSRRRSANGPAPDTGAPEGPHGQTDQEGHYRAVPGELVYNRYRIIKELGHGTFGYVYSGKDEHDPHRPLVAIKMIRHDKKYEYAAVAERDIIFAVQHYFHRNVNIPVSPLIRREPRPEVVNSTKSGSIRVAMELEQTDLSQIFTGHVARMTHSFIYRGHVSIVMPQYGMSLTDLVRLNNYRGFAVPFVQHTIRSLTEGIREIHAAGFIHTDLKPDNVLIASKLNLVKDEATGKVNMDFSSPGRKYGPPTLKVIDLGSATERHAAKVHLVCTRQFRPPEVITGRGWDSMVDMWSLGCIIFELYTGHLLFRTHDSTEHLRLIEKIIGPPTAAFVQNSPSGSFFLVDPRSPTGYRVNCPAGYVAKGRQAGAPDPVLTTATLEEQLKAARNGIEPSPYLVSLLRSLLTWEPRKRLDCAGVLRHAFLMYNGVATQTGEDPEVAPDGRGGAAIINQSVIVAEAERRACRPKPDSIIEVPDPRILKTISEHVRSVAYILQDVTLNRMVNDADRCASPNDRYTRLIACEGLVRYLWEDDASRMRLEGNTMRCPVANSDVTVTRNMPPGYRM